MLPFIFLISSSDSPGKSGRCLWRRLLYGNLALCVIC
uniref:Uncharacterized protein n=1 Tax=Anguilla anguilla TaxID=7936 RepID=A0A0E9XYP6_ANGAN